MNIVIGFLTVVHVLVALCLIGLVLMQKSKDQGVGAAFGAGVTETMFGASTTTALVKLTVYFACALLATTLVLAMLHSHRSAGGGGSYMRKALQSVPKATGTLPLQAPDTGKPVTTPPATPDVEKKSDASTTAVPATPPPAAEQTPPPATPEPAAAP